jgi:hypothetical protein
MKFLIKIFFLFISSILITACAATSQLQKPDKYGLGNQLQQISMIRNPWITDWDKVDNQSFFIRTEPNEYYLIVLMSPSIELNFQESIAISNSNNMIMAGFSSLIVSIGENIKNSYLIDRIFKINGTKQMHEIRDQLTGVKGANP